LGLNGVQRYNIQCQPATPEQFRSGIHPLTVEDLNRSVKEIEEQGKKAKMLILTHPNNPTGDLYSPDSLRDIADWAEAHQIHLIINEIYALSTIIPESGENQFHSFLHEIEARQSPWLHWLYSFSKDFGLSGFRVGTLYTRNSALMSAIASGSGPNIISNQTQWTLMQLLSDEKWVAQLVRLNQERLTQAYRLVTNMLQEVGIPHTHSQGTLFIWADLSAYLERGYEATEEEEQALWLKIYEDTRVLLTGPGAFGHTQRGWFRIVMTCVTPDELELCTNRLHRWFQQNRK